MHTDLRESVFICGPLFFPQTLFESWTPNFGGARRLRQRKPDAPGLN